MPTPKNARDKIHFGNSNQPEAPVAPLRIVVIAELAPVPLPLSRVRVDKESFNDVLGNICPRISILLDPDSSPVAAEFPVQNVKSFTPAQLLEAPLFRALLADRSAAVDLRDGKIGIDAFKARVQSEVLRNAVDGLVQESPAPKPRSTGVPQPPQQKRDDILDSILGMVETGPTSAPAGHSDAAERVQSFISEMFSDPRRSGKVDRARTDQLVKQIESMLAARLNDVLIHPEFRRLEAGWRGLRFLVDRTEFRDGVVLEVFAASRSQLGDCLRMLLEDVDSGAAGFDAVLAAFEFRNTPEDLEIARRAADLAMEMKTPLLISVGGAFFGKASATEVTRIPQLSAHLSSPAFVKWESFRGVESSRWLGAAFNRFLLRNRYETGSARLPFSFAEEGDGLWGDPVWAMGTLLVRSFSQTGWCGHITGLRGGGIMEDLPVREFVLPSGDVRQIPLESVFPRGRETEFYYEGFLALQCGEDRDVAALLDAPVVHRPERYSDAGETEASRDRSKLTYQLVCGRIARFVASELARVSGMSANDVRDGIAAALTRFMGAGGEAAVQVELAESRERGGHYDLAIRIRPGPSVWPLRAALEMNVPLRRY